MGKLDEQGRVRRQELLTCPSETHLNSSKISTVSIQTDLNIPREKPNGAITKCEYGTFQDYRFEHRNTKLISIENDETHLTINRSWLDLPKLDIPIHSDTYCVS